MEHQCCHTREEQCHGYGQAQDNRHEHRACENRQQMLETARGDNRVILEFLLQRDEAGARHAMSIHIRHLINTLQA